MSVNFFGINSSVSFFYESIRKGGLKVPPPATSPNLPPPISDSSDPSLFVSILSNNYFVRIGTFALANIVFLAIAEKINDLAKDFIAQFANTENKQKMAGYGVKGAVTFVGNYVFSKMIQYPINNMALIAITVGAIAAKILYKKAHHAFKSHQENNIRNTAHRNRSTINQQPVTPVAVPILAPTIENTSHLGLQETRPVSPMNTSIRIERTEPKEKQQKIPTTSTSHNNPINEYLKKINGALKGLND